MAKFRLEFEALWQPRKAAIVSLELKRFLSQARGVLSMTPLRVIGAEEPAAPKLLEFGCTNKANKSCATATWKSETFQACPSCGQRRYVHKIDSEPAAEVAS